MKYFIKCLVIYLVTIGMVHGNLPPTTLKGQAETTKPTTFNFEVPNYQSIPTSASARLIETGNHNELQNANFEHSAVTTGWTASNATSSGSTSAIEGKKALSLALTGALSLSQSSTINAARKSGVQMVASIWVNSSDVSDLQLCSLKNGSEDKCTVTGGYVQGSGWRQLTVSFIGDATSNGLKLKSTDTTGTVLVDQAYVGVGSPIVDFTNSTDWEEFTPTFSGIGTPSSVKAFWKRSGDTLEVYGRATSGTVAASGFTIIFSSLGVLIDTSKVVSDVSKGQIAGTFARDSVDGAMFNIGFNSASTNWVYVADGGGNGGLRDSDASAILGSSEKFTFKFAVPIAGWGGKSSKAYVASSSDTDWVPCTFSTLAWQGLGTVTNNLLCSRKGSSLKMKGRVTLGTVSSSQAQIPLPTNYGTITTASNIPSSSFASGIVFREISSQNTVYSIIQIPSVSYLAMSGQLANTAINPNTPSTGSAMFSNGEALSIPELSIPIQGWQDSGVIVGSFQGYNETPGTSRVETFSVSYGTTDATTNCSASPCSYLDQIGNAVTSVTRSGTGQYALNLSKTYTKLKCSYNLYSSGGGIAAFFGGNTTCANCSSLSFNTAYGGGTVGDSFGTLVCQGIPQ